MLCSLSETRPQQAKKTQPVNGNGQFSRKYGSGPPPDQYISEKPSSRAFRIYPTYPPLQGTQEAQMRQQWHQHPKTLRVGIKPDVPERYRGGGDWGTVYTGCHCPVTAGQKGGGGLGNGHP